MLSHQVSQMGISGLLANNLIFLVAFLSTNVVVVQHSLMTSYHRGQKTPMLMSRHLLSQKLERLVTGPNGHNHLDKFIQLSPL